MPRPQPAVIFIFITLFLDIFGIGLVVPVLPGLVEELQGGSVEAASHAVGWLGALYALMQFIFSPILGSLSDRFGRRPVILVSLLGAALDYLLLAWAPSMAWLFVGRIISGITAANFSAASAYIADVTSPEKRAAGFGMIGAAFGLGFIAGPAVGGLLGEFGLRLPFLVAAGVTALNWIYGIFVLPESLTPENRRAFDWLSVNPFKSLVALARWPVVSGLAGAQFLMNLSHNIYPSLWVLYTGFRYGWSTRTVGLSLCVVGLTSAIVQGALAGNIIRRMGERRAVLFGLGLMSVAMVCYGLATEGWMIFVTIILGSIGGVAGPAEQSLISQAVPADEQGAVQGALNSLASVAGVIGPLVWTWIFAASLGTNGTLNFPGLAFIIAGVLTLIALAIAVRVLNRWSPNKA
jgi:DHA1 family tetracycline resistance protein-like MFS transporter